MSRVIDLDNLQPADLEKVTKGDLDRFWYLYRLRVEATEADPELSRRVRDLAHGARQRGDLTAEDHDEILRALNRSHPAVVMDGWRHVLIRRPEGPVVDERVDEWLQGDPRHLAKVIAEMARFTSDLRRIVEAALELADRLGIEEDLADKVICSALHDLREGGRRAG